MRLSIRYSLLLAATLVVAPAAFAQTAVAGFPVTDDCGTGLDNTPTGEAAEMYAMKLPGSTANYTDWLVDTTGKGGASIGLAQVQNPGYIVPANFTTPEAPNHRVFVFLTYSGGRVAVDSGEQQISLGQYDLVRLQHVGDSVPTGTLNGRGLNLAQRPLGGQYDVNMGTGGNQMFPYGAKLAIESVFAPLVEVNPTDVGGCSVGGVVGDSTLSGTQAGQGIILGYNVYRLAGAAGPLPTAATIGAVANWVYFVDTSTFNMGLADAPGAGAGTPAPSDSASLSDVAGWQNPNGTAYDGDELVIFSDQGLTPGGAASGTTPNIADPNGYWYAFQPVVRGSVTAFTSSSINGVTAADHRMDLDGDGNMDAVDLDGVTTIGGVPHPEFISPQAEAGLPGLGLTYKNLPLLSTPVHGAGAPLAAHGEVVLTGQLTNGTVNITLTTAIEAGNVLGFNVYRLDAGGRAKVNEQIIAARGGEGSVYNLVDKAEATSHRVRRDSTLQYDVDVIYNDGTAPRTVGPFSVAATRGESTRRAR